MAQSDILTVPGARRVLGLFGARARRRGLRVNGSIDRVGEGLRALDLPVTYEPIENGIPCAASIGAIRTWGSPWTDVQEADSSRFLTADLARDLSVRCAVQAFTYDYDFTARQFAHQLFDAGIAVDSWTLRDDDDGAAERYLDERLRALRMRDWGLTIDDLQALRLPFPPPLVVEAYFLRLDAAPSRVWRSA